MASAHTTGDRLTREEAELLFEGLMRVLRAAAQDAFIGDRLALAGTTVEVHFSDTQPELSLTLRRRSRCSRAATGMPRCTCTARWPMAQPIITNALTIS
jgi:hypothetical protein